MPALWASSVRLSECRCYSPCSGKRVSQFIGEGLATSFIEVPIVYPPSRSVTIRINVARVGEIEADFDPSLKYSLMGEELVGQLSGSVKKRSRCHLTGSRGSLSVVGELPLSVRCEHSVVEIEHVLVVEEAPFAFVLGQDWLKLSGAFAGFSSEGLLVHWPQKEKSRVEAKKQSGTLIGFSDGRLVVHWPEQVVDPVEQSKSEDDNLWSEELQVIAAPSIPALVHPDFIEQTHRPEKPSIEINDFSIPTVSSRSQEKLEVDCEPSPSVAVPVKRGIEVNVICLIPHSRKDCSLSTDIRSRPKKRVRPGSPSPMQRKRRGISLKKIRLMKEERKKETVREGKCTGCSMKKLGAFESSNDLFADEEVSPSDRPPDDNVRKRRRA